MLELNIKLSNYINICVSVQSYLLPTETPHESLLLKLHRNEVGVTKRGTTDEAARLKDILTKDLSQPQK